MRFHSLWTLLKDTFTLSDCVYVWLCIDVEKWVLKYFKVNSATHLYLNEEANAIAQRERTPRPRVHWWWINDRKSEVMNSDHSCCCKYTSTYDSSCEELISLQGSHSDFKTSKNGKAFYNQGIFREFWTDWNVTEKLHKILQKSAIFRQILVIFKLTVYQLVLGWFFYRKWKSKGKVQEYC